MGLTLIELLVTLAILSILTAAALPYAELSIRRERELELRQALREVRTAIDRFHEDWRSGAIAKTADGASEDGYPKTLRILTDGIDSGDAKGTRRKYLRRVPKDPFGARDKEPEAHWSLVGYQDEPTTNDWNRRDVYDIHSTSNDVAIDGTRYRTW